MCIRDRLIADDEPAFDAISDSLETTLADSGYQIHDLHMSCLLYTSDAADERSSVDLGGRRIIKKKNNERWLQVQDTT